MQNDLLQAFAALRPVIRTSWEKLLRMERINSPLANPDTLVHLLDTTLDEIFRDLQAWSPRRHPTRAADPQCPCGLNPLLAYFTAGRQALREALILVQAATPELEPAKRDEALVCLDQVFGHISRREIASFCAICQIRPAGKARTPARLHVALDI